MDHLIPLARGGKSTKNNCVVSCKECNTKKGHQMSVELTMQEMAERGELGSNDEGDDFGDGYEDDDRD
jgi:5-methylcytosine-specific restriction protein A